MKEKTLLKIALSCAIIGLVILYIACSEININSISNIKGEDTSIMCDNEAVQLKGIVTKVTKTSDSSTMFIEMETKQIINLVVFKPLMFDVEKGEKIEVRGKISEKNGEKSVISDEIRKI